MSFGVSRTSAATIRARMTSVDAGFRARADVASRRQLMRRAATVGLLMRHTVNLVAAVSGLLDPHSDPAPLGRWLLVSLGVWAGYRLATRSHRPVCTAIDVLFILAVCVAMPWLLQDPDFYSYNTAPQAIAGTAVVSFSVSLPARVSLPIAVAIAATYATGAAGVTGIHNLFDVTALYYFVLQWVTAALIRLMLLRVASEVDRVRGERQAAELDQQVTEAVREFEREQLALLHDTAASTLLMVGQGAEMSPSRLAAQARRDLDLLQEGPWVPPPRRVELVSALRETAELFVTPVHVSGNPELWLPGDLGRTVVAAARETLNNVDRHAQAGRVIIEVSPGTVTISDDGIGFDVQRPRTGHGINDSIVGRMARVGGNAVVTSAPGSGSTTMLSWSAEQTVAEAVEPADPERMIDRIRLRYGLALTVYAVVNIAASAPHVLATTAHPGEEIALLLTAAMATVAAVPGIVSQWWRLLWPANAALMVVVVIQSLIVDVSGIGGQAHWVQNAIGWCVLPTALALPTRAGAFMLALFWAVAAGVQLARSPDAEALVNISLGTASILAVQLFALMFNGMMRDAALDAEAETSAYLRLRRREQVAQAMWAEYHRRYASLVDSVVPLLSGLSASGMVDDEVRRRAKAESRRLRTLFDQAATFNDPLMRALRPLIDAAEAREIDVVTELAGVLPHLSDVDIARLVDPLRRVLDLPMESARVVVTAEDGCVTVSLVCRGLDAAADLPHCGSDGVDLVRDGSSLWLLIRNTADNDTIDARV